VTAEEEAEYERFCKERIESNFTINEWGPIPTPEEEAFAEAYYAREDAKYAAKYEELRQAHRDGVLSGLADDDRSRSS